GGDSTVKSGLVFDNFELSLASPAVMALMFVPMVLSVMLKLTVPFTSGAFAGAMAFVSVVVMATTSLAFATTFQCESTALTETVNGFSAVCASGVPVLPVGVPGAAVSPGTKSCNLTNAVSASVTMAGLVPLMLKLSLAVTVCVVFAAVLV